jgi:hypothetical protein
LSMPTITFDSVLILELGRLEGLRLSSDTVESCLIEGTKSLSETMTAVFGSNDEEHAPRLIPAGHVSLLPARLRLELIKPRSLVLL